MPTYQYACTNADCGNRFELVQAFSDPSVTECPVCGQRVRKVYGSVGVVFKGSGFYRNDSRDGAKAASGESKGAAESGAGGESKTSDTSAAKPDAAAKPAAATATSSDNGSKSTSSSSSSSASSSASSSSSSAAAGT